VLIDTIRPEEAPAKPVYDYDTCTLRITVPDLAREGVIDVLSMRSLVRACRYVFARPRQDEFDRALTKMINVNGAMAQAIERGCIRRD